jgi:hypothetical protein
MIGFKQLHFDSDKFHIYLAEEKSEGTLLSIYHVARVDQGTLHKNDEQLSPSG